MISIFLLLLIGVIFYHTRKTNTMDWKRIDDTNSPLLLWYPMAFFIYKKIKRMLEKKDQRLKQQFSSLFFLEKEEVERKVLLFRCQQISIGIIIMIVCFMITTFLSMKNEVLEQSFVIERNPTGQGTKEVDVQLEKKTKEIENYTLFVEEQQYTKEQWEQQLLLAKKFVEKSMIGENSSFDFVTKPLVFHKRMPNSAIKITYTPKEHKWIDDSGNLQLEEVGEEGILTEVTVQFRYKECEAEVIYPIRLMPREKTKEELQYESAIAELKKREQETLYDAQFQLPEKLEEYHVRLPRKNTRTGGWLIVFCILGGILWIIRGEERLKEKEKQRKAQLIKGYPEFIHQLVLLLGAGMTLKGAFIRMGETYEKRKERSDQHYHYLYEEILLSVYEFQAGIAEEVVYRNFGMRTGLTVYKRVIELLIQNLKKGTSDLVRMLGMEENQALEIRKEQAKRMGEQASTKLLMPMILLMAVVLLFVLYPAIVQFQV